MDAWRKWTEKNVVNVNHQRKVQKWDRLLQTTDGKQTEKECICCVSKIHRVFNYEKVKDTSQRWKIAATKKLCYNYLGEECRAIARKSEKSCKNFNAKYHTLICEKDNGSSTQTLTTQDKHIIHPVVIVKVSEIKCQTLLDTAAGSSYPLAPLEH